MSNAAIDNKTTLAASLQVRETSPLNCLNAAATSTGPHCRQNNHQGRSSLMLAQHYEPGRPSAPKGQTSILKLLPCRTSASFGPRQQQPQSPPPSILLTPTTTVDITGPRSNRRPSFSSLSINSVGALLEQEAAANRGRRPSITTSSGGGSIGGQLRYNSLAASKKANMFMRRMSMAIPSLSSDPLPQSVCAS
jgi:hypothetical protein